MTTHAPRGAFRNTTESHAFGRVELYGSNGLRLVGFPLDVVVGLEQELGTEDRRGVVSNRDPKGEHTYEWHLPGKPWLDGAISTDIVITIICAHLHRHSFEPKTILPVAPKKPSAIHLSITWSRSTRYQPNYGMSKRSAFAITFPSPSGIRVVGAPSQDEESILRQIRHAWKSDIKEERALADGCFEIKLKSHRSLFASAAQASSDLALLISTLVQYLDGKGHRLIVSFPYHSKSASPDFFLFDCLESPIRTDAAVPFPVAGEPVIRRERRGSLPIKATAPPAKLVTTKGPPTTQGARRRTWSWSFGRRQNPPGVVTTTEGHTTTTTEAAKPADDWKPFRAPSIMEGSIIYDKQAAVATESVVKRSVRSPSTHVGEIFPSQVTSPAATVNVLPAENSKGKAKDASDSEKKEKKEKRGNPRIEIEEVEDIQWQTSNADGWDDSPAGQGGWVDDAVSAKTGVINDDKKRKTESKRERRVSKETAKSAQGSGEVLGSIHQTIENGWTNTETAATDVNNGWGPEPASNGWAGAESPKSGGGWGESAQSISEWGPQSNGDVASPATTHKEPERAVVRAPDPKPAPPAANGKAAPGPGNPTIKSAGSQHTNMMNGHNGMANGHQVISNSARLPQPNVVGPSRQAPPATAPMPNKKAAPARRPGPYDIWRPSESAHDMNPSAPLPPPNTTSRTTQNGLPKPHQELFYNPGGLFGPPTPPPPEEIERKRREEYEKKWGEWQKQEEARRKKAWEASRWAMFEIDKRRQLGIQAQGGSVAGFVQQTGQPLPFGLPPPAAVPQQPRYQDVRGRGAHVEPAAFQQWPSAVPQEWPHAQNPYAHQQQDQGRGRKGGRKNNEKGGGKKKGSDRGGGLRWQDDVQDHGYSEGAQEYDGYYQSPRGRAPSVRHQPAQSPRQGFGSLGGFTNLDAMSSSLANMRPLPGAQNHNIMPSIAQQAAQRAAQQGLASKAYDYQPAGAKKTKKEKKAESEARRAGEMNGYPMYQGVEAMTQDNMLAGDLHSRLATHDQGRSKIVGKRGPEFAGPVYQNGNARVERGRSKERGGFWKTDDRKRTRQPEQEPYGEHGGWPQEQMAVEANGYPGTGWDSGASHSQPYTAGPLIVKEPAPSGGGIRGFFKGLGKKKNDPQAQVGVYQTVTTTETEWDKDADASWGGHANAYADGQINWGGGGGEKAGTGWERDAPAGGAWGPNAPGGGWGATGAQTSGRPGNDKKGKKADHGYNEQWKRGSGGHWAGAATAGWDNKTTAANARTIRHTGGKAQQQQQPIMSHLDEMGGAYDLFNSEEDEEELANFGPDYDDYDESSEAEENLASALDGLRHKLTQTAAASGLQTGRMSPAGNPVHWRR